MANPLGIEPDLPEYLPPRSLADRLHYALGPLAGGMLIDFADLITPGPVGVFGGLLVGMPVGWWVASIYGFSVPSRCLIATLAGIYCTIPGTELIPLATMVSAIARFFAETPGSTSRGLPPAESAEPSSHSTHEPPSDL
jgi:hypothetical protein